MDFCLYFRLYYYYAVSDVSYVGKETPRNSINHAPQKFSFRGVTLLPVEALRNPTCSEID